MSSSHEIDHKQLLVLVFGEVTDFLYNKKYCNSHCNY